MRSISLTVFGLLHSQHFKQSVSEIINSNDMHEQKCCHRDLIKEKKVGYNGTSCVFEHRVSAHITFEFVGLANATCTF